MKAKLVAVMVMVWLIIFPTQVWADVLLNEISSTSDPEWVELYNTDNNDINLEGWYVTDEQIGAYNFGVVITVANQNPVIPGKGYLVLEGGVGKTLLRNDPGEKLTLYDGGNQIIDSYTYGSMSSGKSESRIPDGFSSWVTNTGLTKGSTNPTPTPTPTNVPTPTPTSQPTPTSTPVPTNTPTPKPTATPKPTLTPTPSTVFTSGSTPEESIRTPSGVSPRVLGETIDVSPTPATKSFGLKQNIRVSDFSWPLVMVAIGVGLVLTAIGWSFWSKRFDKISGYDKND